MKITQKLISDWQAAKALLDVTKAREMELRKKLCSAPRFQRESRCPAPITTQLLGAN